MTLIDINGTRLFTDIRGDEDAPPALFIHGGPGAGSWDFMETQGDRLAEHLRIIGVDQRGVLRSDPIDADAPLNRDVLVADFEALREALGIDRWTIIGHSAGGMHALQYAHDHPESVAAAILDCTTFDFPATDRLRLPIVERILTEIGDEEGAARCRELLAKPGGTTAEDKTFELFLRMGEARFESMVIPGPGRLTAFTKMWEKSGFSAEEQNRGTTAHRRMRAEFYAGSLTRLLPGLRIPTLMFEGAHDWTTPPEHVDAYRAAVPDARVEVFADSGHYPWFEEPGKWAEAVTGFVLKYGVAKPS